MHSSPATQTLATTAPHPLTCGVKVHTISSTNVLRSIARHLNVQGANATHAKLLSVGRNWSRIGGKLRARSARRLSAEQCQEGQERRRRINVTSDDQLFRVTAGTHGNQLPVPTIHLTHPRRMIGKPALTKEAERGAVQAAQRDSAQIHRNVTDVDGGAQKEE